MSSRGKKDKKKKKHHHEEDEYTEVTVTTTTTTFGYPGTDSSTYPGSDSGYGYTPSGYPGSSDGTSQYPGSETTGYPGTTQSGGYPGSTESSNYNYSGSTTYYGLQSQSTIELPAGDSPSFLPPNFFLKSLSAGFLGSEFSGQVTAHTRVPKDFETWTAEEVNGRCAFRNHLGRYLAIGVYGTIYIADSPLLSSAQFVLSKLQQEIILIQSAFDGQYLGADSYGRIILYPSVTGECNWTVYPSAEYYTTGSPKASSSSSSSSDKKHKEIVKFDNRDWELVNGLLSMISVGDGGNIWGVNKHHQVYRFFSEDQSWRQVPTEEPAILVSVSYDGEVWMVDKHGSLWRREADIWTLVPGATVKDISVGSKQYIWGVDEHDHPVRWNGVYFARIGKEKITTLSVGRDGSVWAIPKKKYGKQVLVWEGDSWVSVKAKFTYISVVSSDIIWAVDKKMRTFKYEAATKAWTPDTAKFCLISASADDVWGIDEKSGIWRKKIQNRLNGYFFESFLNFTNR
eukprot:TRINITY_DN1588_c0_g1_i4.p1 TRINITY_DN1588_c0_g1~~TRINITY_DN1588_c0_g1_i4.p1  ORF type:complete len:512 (-),score=112.27 TRINITY_DN1588_c0_g1_i4:1358-2893(-)